MSVFTIDGSLPRGADYKALLQAALDYCDRMSVVLRGDCREPCQGVLDRLGDYLIVSERVTSWPGTTLLQGDAEMRTYRYAKETAVIVQGVAHGFEDWQEPALPEDLCLYDRTTRRPWLTSIAHESDVYLDLSTDQHAQLASAMPNLVLVADDPG